MTTQKPRIDPFLFEQQFKAFTSFVEEKSNLPFRSFASHPFTDNNEGYKREIYSAAREALSFQAWLKTDIGTGDIITASIAAIEIPGSNLVPWHERFGKDARPHQPLYEALETKTNLSKIESCLYRLYLESKDNESFEQIIDIFGKTYPLVAYFFFLKDRSKFLPIAPTFFDRAFELLGIVDFKTSRRCSWENYTTYIDLIRDIKVLLSEHLSTEVALLDAHSFAWILSSQMQKENKTADVKDYLNLSEIERKTIINARIGQGQFRENLINYWSACSVTGCSELKLLRASHIKPWTKSDTYEKLNLYNGLLLSPALDACFDAGYISFDDVGNILISSELSANDLAAMGINKDMKLSKIEPEHNFFLRYHREEIFNKC